MQNHRSLGRLGRLALYTIGLLPAMIHAAAPLLPLPTRVVAQLPLGTWFENLYVRPDGSILLGTLQPNASVYLLSEPASSSPRVTLVHTFAESDGVLGITETEPDVFAVAAGSFSNPGEPVEGSARVWQLDLRRRDAPARVSLIAALPDAGFLNGIDNAPCSPTTVLISDSALGLVWELDTRTGRYGVAVRDDAMAVVEGALISLGVNGVRVHKGYLYWTNTFAASIYRLRITPDGHRAPAAVSELVSKASVPALDDLYFGPGREDLIWAPTNLGNMLVAASDGVNRTATVVAGAPGELTLPGGTACRFGRGPADRETLYVVTSGALVFPVNGTISEGGKIVAVDTSSYVAASKGGRRWDA